MAGRVTAVHEPAARVSGSVGAPLGLLLTSLMIPSTLIHAATDTIPAWFSHFRRLEYL